MSKLSSDSEQTYMTIHIDRLTISAIIGILDFERTTPQEVLVDMNIDYHYSEGNFINYAEVIALLEGQIVEKKYKLLEDALTDLRDTILQSYPQIKKIYLKITKPTIIPNAQVALSISSTN